jgi:hypothetical protein
LSILDFGSLLEIFAAFAFAYFGISNFSKILSKKIFRASERLEKKIDDLNEAFANLELNFEKFRGTISELRETLDKLGRTSEKRNLKSLDGFFDEFTELKDEFNNEEKKIKKLIELWRDPIGFSHLSLFSAIYCIILLFLGGVYEELSNRQDTIIVIVALFAVFHILVSLAFPIKDLIKGKEIKYQNYFTLILWFFLSLISSAYIFLFESYLPPPEINKFYSNVVIIVSIAAPISHYVTYFIRFLYIEIFESNPIISRLDKEYQKSIDDLNKITRTFE